MADLPTGTVTFLFTDIEGSTKLVQELGDGFRALLEDHNRLLRTAFSNGVEVRMEGDAFFMAFASARDGVEAAIAGQRALAGHSWPDDLPLRVRMGLHTGVGTLGGADYVGVDVHRAARSELLGPFEANLRPSGRRRIKLLAHVGRQQDPDARGQLRGAGGQA